MKINECLQEKLRGLPNTSYFPIEASLFVNVQDGTISHHDMYDYLHLTKTGFQKLSEPLLEEIETLLKNFLAADTASVGEADQLTSLG